MHRLAFAPLWLLAASLCAAPVPPRAVPQGGVLAPWGVIDAVNGTGFVAAPDCVYAFDLAAGRLLWKLASRNARPVGVYRGRVLVLLRDGRERVVQLDRRTGKELARSEPVSSRVMGKGKGGFSRESEARVVGDVLVLGRSFGPPPLELGPDGLSERRFGRFGGPRGSAQIDLTTGKAPEKRVTVPPRPRRVQDLLPKGVSVPGGGRFGPLFGRSGDAVFLLHSTSADEQRAWHLARWDAKTGRALPPTTVGEGSMPRLSGDGAAVLIGPRNDADGMARFEALSTATGRSIGSFERPQRAMVRWTVYGERAYVLSSMDQEEPGGRTIGLLTLYAIELKTGKMAWSLLLAARPEL